MQAVTSHRSSACDRLDDEIAALEVAVRLAVPAEDVDFDALLDRAESDADDA